MDRTTSRERIAEIRRLAEAVDARMDTAPVAYPLDPPAYAGNMVTVDTALEQPTRITRFLSDMTLQNLIVSAIFGSGPQPTGGAVVYDQQMLNELYLARDVERVAPGDEFPIVTSTRQAPKVAEVEKYGGKLWISDEARQRNQARTFTNMLIQLGNTIIHKLNARAIAELEAAMTAMAGATTFVGNNWQAVVTAGVNASEADEWPDADFANAQLAADIEELGVVYDLWLINPRQHARLKTVYKNDLPEVLDSHNIALFPSNRVAAGTAYAVARQQVGEIGIENPLGTETWREPGTQRNWVQSSVRPVMYVTNPYSIRKVTGLNGS